MTLPKSLFLIAMFLSFIVALAQAAQAKGKPDVQVREEERSVTYSQNSEIQPLQGQEEDSLDSRVDISIEHMLSLMGQQRDKYKSMDAKLASNSYKYIDGKKELQFSREIIYRREGENVFSKVLNTNYQSNKSGYKRARIVSIKSDQSRSFQMEENQRSPRVTLYEKRISESELHFVPPYHAMWFFFGHGTE